MFDESAYYYKNVVFSLNQLVIELPQRAVSRRRTIVETLKSLLT